MLGAMIFTRPSKRGLAIANAPLANQAVAGGATDGCASAALEDPKRRPARPHLAYEDNQPRPIGHASNLRYTVTRPRITVAPASRHSGAVSR